MDNINILTQFPINDPIISAGLNMPTFTDIDQDNDMDLFVTTLSGAFGYQLSNNFTFYEREEEEFIYKTSNFINTLDLLSDINPKYVDIDNDNDLDLFIGTDFDPSSFPWSGKLLLFENIGFDILNEEPIWEQITPDFLNENIGNNLYPEFVDIDYDGDLDLFIGDFNGLLHYFLNTGTENQSNFNYQGEIDGIDHAGYSTPEFVDIDNDDDFDLLIGDITGSIYLYHNIGDKYEFNFNLSSQNYGDINVEYRSTILSINFDNDNDYDLLVGSGNNNISYYKNTGDEHAPDFELSDEIVFPNLGLNISLDFYNTVNEIGFIAGISTGGCYYLSINNIILGDINQDEIINIFDIILAIELILDGDSYEYYADLNQDGLIDVIDVVNLINIILDN